MASIHAARSESSLALNFAIGGTIGSRLGSRAVTHSLMAHAGAEPFQLAPLPYRHDSLEPCIDSETMRWHHDILHASYVQGLNEALKGKSIVGQSLEDLLAELSSNFATNSDAVRFHGGGHWNHTFFWSVMTDCKEDHEMPPYLKHAIEDDFKSVDRFKEVFVEAGASHPGSGWVWLVRSESGRLEVRTTSNNDNPLMDVFSEKSIPLLVCDLWEHAYFLHYKAKRDEFLRKFFAVVNWARVGALAATDLH